MFFYHHQTTEGVWYIESSTECSSKDCLTTGSRSITYRCSTGKCLDPDDKRYKTTMVKSVPCRPRCIKSNWVDYAYGVKQCQQVGKFGANQCILPAGDYRITDGTCDSQGLHRVCTVGTTLHPIRRNTLKKETYRWHLNDKVNRLSLPITQFCRLQEEGDIEGTLNVPLQCVNSSNEVVSSEYCSSISIPNFINAIPIRGDTALVPCLKLKNDDNKQIYTFTIHIFCGNIRYFIGVLPSGKRRNRIVAYPTEKMANLVGCTLEQTEYQSQLVFVYLDNGRLLAYDGSRLNSINRNLELVDTKERTNLLKVNIRKNPDGKTFDFGSNFKVYTIDGNKRLPVDKVILGKISLKSLPTLKLIGKCNINKIRQ